MENQVLLMDTWYFYALNYESEKNKPYEYKSTATFQSTSQLGI